MTKISLPSQRQVGHLTMLRQGRQISRSEYNALTVEEQLDMIHQAQGKQKYDLILNAERPENLVAKLHPQELYLTINELGAEYSTELLMLATPEQVTVLLDLDCWEGDNLSGVLSLYWLELLLSTGEEKIRQLVRQLEPETLALFLKKHLTIIRGLEVYDDDEAENAKRLEGIYDIQFASEDAAKIIGALLKIWQELEQESYLLVMEMIRSESYTVFEEEIYLSRNHRLLDLGIIPANEAKSIYSHIDPETFKPGGKKDFRLEAEDLLNPSALLAQAEPHSMLAEILATGIDHDSACELMHLLNRKMSADRIDLSAKKEVSEALQTTYDTLNLALEYLACSDANKAEKIFRETYLLQLFQLGHSLIKKQQSRAETLLISSIYPFLDYPELLFLDAFVQQPVCLYLAGSDDNPGQLRRVTSLKDLELADLRLKQIESLERLFNEILPFGLPEAESDELPTLSGIFMTAVANQLLDREFAPTLLTRTDLSQLKDKTSADDQRCLIFRENLEKFFEDRVPTAGFFSDFCLELWEDFFLDYNRQEATLPAECFLLVADQDN